MRLQLVELNMRTEIVKIYQSHLVQQIRENPYIWDLMADGDQEVKNLYGNHSQINLEMIIIF